MKKKILLTVLSLSCALTCAAGLSACDFGFGGSNDGENNLNNGNDDSNFRFELTENGRGLVLTNYLGSETQIVIPAEYNGAPVTEIDRAVLCRYAESRRSRFSERTERNRRFCISEQRHTKRFPSRHGNVRRRAGVL